MIQTLEKQSLELARDSQRYREQWHLEAMALRDEMDRTEVCLFNNARPNILPHKVKMQYVHFRSYTKYFLLPWKIREESSRRSLLFHN